MLELRLAQGNLLKKVLEPIKDIVDEANFDCSKTSCSLQGHRPMDFVELLLRAEGFEHYRCDKHYLMGMNLNYMSTMFKCAGNDDIITIKADDASDKVNFVFESPNKVKVSDFEMHLMDIDVDRFDFPEAEYDANIRMPSAQFAKICRDFSQIDDTVVISVIEEGVKFSITGEIGTASVVCRHTPSNKPEEATLIERNKSVELPFSLRYMISFIKATPISNTVTISISSMLPLVVDYNTAEMGYIRLQHCITLYLIYVDCHGVLVNEALHHIVNSEELDSSSKFIAIFDLQNESFLLMDCSKFWGEGERCEGETMVEKK
ncbi:proliferating cell nuclear antigen-like [Spinacia oleracea]|uniref:DNA sliding clamp PCNA n=1 Tax=Spinacia oleracea TaxID=3562 RepID=A0ABM3R942_SPIOL|nr:proliferating cell nuclear antigen-like [Spinacia oleracea]